MSTVHDAVYLLQWSKLSRASNNVNHALWLVGLEVENKILKEVSCETDDVTLRCETDDVMFSCETDDVTSAKFGYSRSIPEICTFLHTVAPPIRTYSEATKSNRYEVSLYRHSCCQVS